MEYRIANYVIRHRQWNSEWPITKSKKDKTMEIGSTNKPQTTKD